MVNEEKAVTLAHGSGGQQTAELIERVFKRRFDNPDLSGDDAAVLRLGAERLAMTTDGFIVSPWRFPGGNVGKLSVCGTVNDLACMGARPEYLSCALVLEEGFALDALEEIAEALADTAHAAGVHVVAGDTKVAGRGQVDGVFITTTGIGRVLPGVQTSGALARPGDAIIVTGDVGRHGCAILLARNEFGISSEVTSDCAPLWTEVQAMFAAMDAVGAAGAIHAIRDATRGGLGTVLYEIAGQSGVGFRIEAAAVPVDRAVQGVCDMLGLSPLYLACEGRLVIFAPREHAGTLVAALKACPHGQHAAVIGEVSATQRAGTVVLKTRLGAETFLPRPGGELLPRIC